MGYELLDCGSGRKVERLGDVRVIRPAPAATERPRDADAWVGADLEWNRNVGWIGPRDPSGTWEATIREQCLELRATDTGQVGFFPEHEKIRAILRMHLTAGEGSLRVLDLFGYTGASTLVAASLGADVTYVDGAKPMVAWLRRNLKRNGLSDAPVRSIADDAARFVEREVKRERHYDVVLVDPPSFGRGPDGRTFKIDRDLDGLLANVRRVLSDRPRLIALTAHTESWTHRRLLAALDRAMDGLGGRSRSGDLVLRARSGAKLRAGMFAVRECEG